MTLTLKEAKEYLRVDYDDDDALIQTLVNASEELVSHIARKSLEEIDALYHDTLKIALLFSTAYLYEHREDADHHLLTLTLRSLLFGIREEAF